jgi:hypothetical protein
MADAHVIEGVKENDVRLAAVVNQTLCKSQRATLQLITMASM